MSHQPYDRKEEAKRQVRAERALMRRMTCRTGWQSIPVVFNPPLLTEAELAEARRAVDAEERVEAAKQQVRGERALMRRMTCRTGWRSIPVVFNPPLLTEAELMRARIAVDAEERVVEPKSAAELLADVGQVNMLEGRELRIAVDAEEKQ